MQRHAAVTEIRKLLARGPVFIDTETTGLGGSAQVVQVAVVNYDGQPLLDTLVRPTKSIPPAASRIHNIADLDVEDAPGFDVVLPDLVAALAGRMVVAYNADFDARMLNQSAKVHGLEVPTHSFYCAMDLYSCFHRGRKSRWQSLENALHQCQIVTGRKLHNAKVDANMTRHLLFWVACRWGYSLTPLDVAELQALLVVMGEYLEGQDPIAFAAEVLEFPPFIEAEIASGSRHWRPPAVIGEDAPPDPGMDSIACTQAGPGQETTEPE